MICSVVLRAFSINVVSSWSDRISFVLLFGVATSVEVFEERLPQSSLKHLERRSFNAVQSQELLERIFCSTIVGSNIPFRIGPNLAQAIIKRPKENIQSPNEFIDALQVCV
jgi:origin recognition complex subunit 3